MLGCIIAENAVGWALDPLNQPLTPYRLHRSLCSDGLKHFIVLPVTACAFSGVLLRMKNVRFTVGADVRCVTVLPNM